MEEKEDREDCFARINSLTCSALLEKKCKNCKFYRNNINRLEIEREINAYRSYKAEYGDIDG